MNRATVFFVLLILAVFLLCTENPSEPQNRFSPGIVDYESVDGVELNRTTGSGVIQILGIPWEINEAGGYHYYYYPKRGLKFILKDQKVIGANIYSRGWQYQLGGDTLTYEGYPYKTREGIVVGDTNSTMDSVVARYGLPSKKGSRDESGQSQNPTWYFQYESPTEGAMRFYFRATSVNNYTQKPITLIEIW